ncbi:hypothetical protein PK98_04395 [Croceibacterium mercuriale]|uniref:Uncharacterized protein n=1 Tax=Croceibacterium mercuriale TaxID=1572751 RepID=A0A0B2BWR0_9SPHN|nr:hypothetical protein [Croceibacterium mercuriale]KHL25849.1 hypothetical protein PK98_04395 [Croceibacterium mercuriale]
MYDFIDRPLVRQDRNVQLFVWSMRQWASAALDGRCVCRLVSCAFRSAELKDAVEPLHQAMHALCHHGHTSMRFGAVQRSAITEHEAILLSALIAAGNGQHRTLDTICTALVTSEAAPVLSASLQALSGAFADAELGFATVNG